MSDDGPFCEIYIDHRGPTAVIERLLVSLTAGRLTDEGIVTDGLKMFVDHGDSHPPIEQRDYSQWINWKYRIDVEPVSDDIADADFAIPLKGLLKKLHDAGVRAVPACQFEELLAPWNWVDAQD